MSVGLVQLYNGALEYLFSDAGYQWDESAGNKFAFCLAESTYTPLDTHSTLNNVGLSNLITAGDGAPIAVANRALVESAGTIQFNSDDADFGDPVTVPEVLYLLCTAGDYSGGYTLTTSDRLIFWCQLDELGIPVSTYQNEFVVYAPPNGTWFRVNAQV